MKYLFETARGSVIGTKHARAGGNNQDSSYIHQNDQCMIAVVCDGCSSGEGAASHNEVGSQIGARLIASTLYREIMTYGSVNWIWARKQIDMDLQTLWGILRGVDDGRAAVLDYLLFTSIAIVMTDNLTEIATIGDGVVIVNDAPVALPEVLKGAPDYLGYNLTTRARRPVEFNVVTRMPTSDLQSFFIGSDGCNDLAAAAERAIPGTEDPIGPLSQFWTDDRFYGEGHGDALRRRLALANGGVWKDRAIGEVWKRPSLLHDDTTCVVGRRVRDEAGLVTS